uniref:EAL domain-containing protein n=1 Tax=uncultured Demequina sp. TaxID=693499 RepID=UPI0025DF24CD
MASIEVTETLIMSDFETARSSLARLQQLGSRVALDDFGVGYANFGHIDQLSINTIKIDRSFVTRLANGGQTVKLIKTMVDMCSTLGVGSI